MKLAGLIGLLWVTGWAWTVWAFQRARRDFDTHAEQALRLLDIPPEDRPEWGLDDDPGLGARR